MRSSALYVQQLCVRNFEREFHCMCAKSTTIILNMYMPLSVNEIFFNKHILSAVDGLDDDVLDVMILCNRRKYKS